MLWNLTCERRFHSALLEADVTDTLLELLGSSSTQNTKKIPKQTTSTIIGGGGGGGSATTASLISSTPSSGAVHVHDGASGTAGLEHSIIPGEDGDVGEIAQGSSSGAGSAKSGGAGVGGGLDTGGAVGGGTSSSSSGGLAKGGGGKGSHRVSNDTGGSSRMSSPEAAGTGLTATLEVRRNVLGAVMNLTSFSISDPRLDPKAVMSLLTLIMQEDPKET